MNDSSPQPAAVTCEHCDDSVPHEHVDERPLVDGFRSRLRIAAIALGVVTLGWVTLAIIISTSWLSPTLGALAWLVATALGLAVHLVTQSQSSARRMIWAAGATAAAMPIAAAVAAFLRADSVGAGLGWLLPAAAVLAWRNLSLRTQLVAHTRAGEAARSGVVRSSGRPDPVAEAAWLAVTALLFAGYVAATAALPVIVVLLVPLNVALAMATRRWTANQVAKALQTQTA